MTSLKHTALSLFVLSVILAACNPNKSGADKHSGKLIKGLYSYGPELKSFTDCEEGREYWVADSAKTLELAYSKFNFEKPYEPVYIEAECHVIKSDSLSVSSEFDSTLVVTRLIKITKAIPDGPCNP
jgi:copper homeostasis protein (lipoprotein)